MFEETTTWARSAGALSRAAKGRMLAQRGEPLFFADWADTLMVHLEVDPTALQRATPFPLDLFEGRAFVSLVFFTMRRLRPRVGGRIGEWLLRPIGQHELLNVRTYVRPGGEPGIFFLAEWIPNVLSVQLGPALFGLPYRLGTLSYRHDATRHVLEGEVVDRRTATTLAYRGRALADDLRPCPNGSLDEWLMERYVALTQWGKVRRFFRVWHRPWPQVPVEFQFLDDTLLHTHWPWLAHAAVAGAQYSPGCFDVWIGRAHRLERVMAPTPETSEPG